MSKTKYIIIALFVCCMLLLIPNFTNAESEVSVSRNIYAKDGSSKYTFTGLVLDPTHQYEFSLTKTSAEESKNWFLIVEYDSSTATVDVNTSYEQIRSVILAVENGFITIRDVNEPEKIVLNHHEIDLSIPYLSISNYTVLNNGKDLSNNITINIWNASNSTAYYQYEKITDEKVISKYKEIKSQNGDFNDLQPLLKTAPKTNWYKWKYWNGHGYYDKDGFGYPTQIVNVPDYGLYYMWINCAGSGIRSLYGCILVDNLEPEIALDSISLPKTAKVELGKTLTLTPTFNPENTTNKIVTWSSSDESIATVDNTGKVTPKKIGSAIITVTSQYGNKKATCTVTVTEKAVVDNNNGNTGTTTPDTNNDKTNSGSTNNNNSNNNNSNSNNSNTNNGSSSQKPSTQKDNTTASGKIPQTGVGVGLSISILVIIGVSTICYLRYRRYRDI